MITQYADDAMLFLNSKEELCSALNVINEFGQMAGTKLSIGKCEGLEKINICRKIVRYLV